MTSGLDIVTKDAGEQVRTARARDSGEEALVALYRLAQMVRVHDVENQAFSRALEQTHRAVVYYCLHAGSDLVILFAERVVLIGGQLLQGTRAAYEAAAELGEHLMWCGGAELTIQRDVQPKDLKAFAEALGTALRNKKTSEFKSPTTKIKLRPVADSVRVRGLTLERLKFEQRLVRTYASAVVVMRRFFEALRAGRLVLPRRLKRIAQNLVDLSEGKAPAFLGVTEVRNANHDDAGRAVNTAILAVAAAREITADRLVLSQIAMAALMHDVGRPRAESKLPKGAIAARLSDWDEDHMPSGTAVVLTAVGRLNEPTIARTVITYESLWVKRQASLGPVYDGMLEPTLQARIIAIARRYNDLLTPEPGLAPPLPDFAVATLANELTDATDRTILRMLVSALGLMPVGTVVQLAAGETAEVLPSEERRPPHKPRLKIVVDARGGILNPPRVVDLLKQEGKLEVRRVISTDGWTKGLEPVEEGEARVSDVPPSNPPSSVQSEASYPSTEAPSTSASLSLGWQQEPPPRASAPPAVPRPPIVIMPDSGGDERTLYEPSPYGAEEEQPEDEPEEGTQFFRREANPALRPQPVALPDRATATGNFKNTPLPHVLVYMLDRGFTGSLVIRDPDSKSHVMYFEGGVPTRVQVGNPIAPIGEELIAARLIAPPAMDACTMAARQQGLRVSDFLVQQGLVAAEGMTQALRSQLLHRVEWLVKLPDETTYEFYQDFNALARWAGDGQAECEPLDIILAANRVWRSQARIVATLTKLANHPIVLHAEVDLSGLSLTPEEQILLEMIRSKPQSMDDLYNQYAVSDKVVSTLLYTLLVTRQLVLPGQQKPPMRPTGAARAVRKSAPTAAPLPVPTPPPMSVPIPPISMPAPSQGPLPQVVAPPLRQSSDSIPASGPRSGPPQSMRSAPVSDPSPAPRSGRVPPPWREDPSKSQRSPLAGMSYPPVESSPGPNAETSPPPAGRKMPKPWAEFKKPSTPAEPEPTSSPPEEAIRKRASDPVVAVAEAREDTPPGDIPVDVSDGENEDSEELSSDSHPSFPSFGTSPSQVVEAMDAYISQPHSQPAGPVLSTRPGGSSGHHPAKATAKGDLTSTPMVHILVYMLDHDATGSVVLREPEGVEHLLEFRDGCPIKIKTGRPVALLGEMLVEGGLITTQVVEQAVGEAALIDAPLGEFLVLQDLVQRGALEVVLQEQMMRKLAAIANQTPGTTYSFYRDVSLLENWGGKVGVRLEPLRAVLATVRAWTDRNRIRGTLYKMKDRKLIISSQGDVSCLISDETALSILASIEPGDATVMDLYRRRLADEEEVNALIYTLAVMRYFSFSAAKGPPMGLGPRRL
ncbi:MAG: hypothetical protein HY898_18530 [Deltaproteobacteria bacterium]|nr:hypothetical protein [Deltaproteobacteria bacterium]